MSGNAEFDAYMENQGDDLAVEDNEGIADKSQVVVEEVEAIMLKSKKSGDDLPYLKFKVKTIDTFNGEPKRGSFLVPMWKKMNWKVVKLFRSMFGEDETNLYLEKKSIKVITERFLGFDLWYDEVFQFQVTEQKDSTYKNYNLKSMVEVLEEEERLKLDI